MTPLDGVTCNSEEGGISLICESDGGNEELFRSGHDSARAPVGHCTLLAGAARSTLSSSVPLSDCASATPKGNDGEGLHSDKNEIAIFSDDDDDQGSPAERFFNGFDSLQSEANNYDASKLSLDMCVAENTHDEEVVFYHREEIFPRQPVRLFRVANRAVGEDASTRPHQKHFMEDIDPICKSARCQGMKNSRTENDAVSRSAVYVGRDDISVSFACPSAMKRAERAHNSHDSPTVQAPFSEPISEAKTAVSIPNVNKLPEKNDMEGPHVSLPIARCTMAAPSDEVGTASNARYLDRKTVIITLQCVDHNLSDEERRNRHQQEIEAVKEDLRKADVRQAAAEATAASVLQRARAAELSREVKEIQVTLIF